MTLEEGTEKLIEQACLENKPMIVIFADQGEMVKMYQNIGEENLLICLVRVIKELEAIQMTPKQKEYPQ